MMDSVLRLTAVIPTPKVPPHTPPQLKNNNSNSNNNNNLSLVRDTKQTFCAVPVLCTKDTDIHIDYNYVLSTYFVYKT